MAIDVSGLGSSSGHFPVVDFRYWLEDCEAAAGHTDNDNLVMVAPSMGAVVAVNLVHKLLPKRVSAVLMAAPAVTAFQAAVQAWYETLDSDLRARVERGETVTAETYFGPVPLRKAILDSIDACTPDPEKPIDMGGARVVILHGKMDETVPYEESLRLSAMMTNTQGPVTVVPSHEGKHRLNDMADLALLGTLLDQIMEKEMPSI